MMENRENNSIVGINTANNAESNQNNINNLKSNIMSTTTHETNMDNQINQTQQASSLMEKVNDSIQEFASKSKPVSLPTCSDVNDVLDDILTLFNPVDFNRLAAKPNGKPANIMDKTVFVIEEVKKISAQNNRKIKLTNGSLSVYNGRNWQILERNETMNFLSRAAEKMGMDISSARFYSRKEKLYKQLFSSTYEKETPATGKSAVINFLNYTVEISTVDGSVTSREHRAEDNFNYCLQHNYNPDAVCPGIQKFLDKVLPDKADQDILFEYLGYIFTRGYKIEKILILLGTGANGKSVMFDIVKSFLGSPNITEYSLEAITKDTGYCRIHLQDVLLNYGPDINDRLDPDALKTMASGEPIRAREIYKPSTTIYNYSKLIFNSNIFPVKDAECNNGFIRRFIYLLFNVTIQEEKRNIHLAEELCTPDELRGFANLIILGIQRLIRQNGLSTSKSSEKATADFRDEINPINDFLFENSYVRSTRESMPLQELYCDYRDFCEVRFEMPLGIKKFSRQLKQSNFIIERLGGKTHQVFITKEKNESAVSLDFTITNTGNTLDSLAS